MKKNLLLVLFLSVSFGLFAQEPLPKWMTEEEKAIYPQYLESLSYGKATNPPPAPPRTPGEWEENQGVVITWTSYTSQLREIVRHAREYVTVYIVCSDSNTVKSSLINGNVPLTNIKYVVADYNSVWVRDYGPHTVYLQGTNELAIIDWVYNRPRPADNLVPSVIANFMNLPIYQMTVNPNKLVATGGNFMADGHGKGFSSNLILDENSNLTEAQINTIKYNYMGITPYVKMNTLPYDGIHHIDMHMKLLDDETLLVGQYPTGVADGPQIEANLQYVLNNYQTPYGRPYRVVRIPMPPSPGGNYPPSSNYYTYTNSVILNGLVLVPIYGLALDQTALNIYQEAMPGYKIVGINMSSVISASGAIHCITHELAANDPIFISHARILEAESTQATIPVKAYIETASGVQSAKVFWSTDTLQGYNEAMMTLQNDTFVVQIPGQSCGQEVFYYISATNNNGKTIARPLVGSKGPYKFEAFGEEADFIASATDITMGDAVTFSDASCLTYSNYTWNFGQDAQPATATGVGPHQVVYNSVGAKTISLTLDGNQTITKENFIVVNAPQYLLTIEVEGQGGTTPVPGNYSYVMGTEVELAATPAAGWKFDAWEVGEITLKSDEPVITITMNADMFAKAIFSEIESSLTEALSGQISIFPNPTNGMLTLSRVQAEGSFQVIVSNAQGQEVMQATLNPGQSTLLLDLNAQSAGVYFIRMIGEGNVFLHKIIKN